MSRTGCIYGVLFLVLLSCDDTRDYFQLKNTQPKLYFLNSSGEPLSQLEDSLKIGFTREYPYYIEDEEELSIGHNEAIFTGIEIAEEKVRVTGVKEGLEVIQFSVTDAYELNDQTSLSFTVYRNLAPVAILSHDIIRIDDSYMLELDGSASFDKDDEQGGKVIQYKYSIDSYSITTPRDKITYSVNTNKTYVVRFEVMDNDQEWSQQVVMYISI